MAEQFDQLKITQEAAEGKRTFSKPVRMIDEDGEQYEMLPEEVQEAARSGYKIATPEQRIAKDEAKQAGLLGTAKVFLGQAADEFLGGVPETALELTESPLERERRLALKAESPIANIAGGVIGAGVSALTPVGPLALAEKAALKGTQSALKFATTRGGSLASKILTKQAEQGIEYALKGTLGKVAQKGVEVAAEAGLQQLPSSAIEAALGDPENAAENFMIATGVGGALGVTGKGIGEISSKIKNSAYELISKNQNIPKQLIKETLEKTGESADELFHIQPADIKLSDIYAYEPAQNLEEISKAAKELGISEGDLTPAMTTDKPLYKYTSSAIAKNPISVGGAMEAKAIEKVKSQVDLEASLLARDAEEYSKMEAGSTIKSKLVDEVGGKIKEARAGYELFDNLDANLPSTHAEVIPEKVISDLKMEVPRAKYKTIVTEYSEMMNQAKTVGALQEIKTYLNSDLGAALISKDIKTVDIINHFKGMVDDAIQKTAGPEATAILKKSNKLYSEQYSRIEPLFKMLGLKKPKNASHMLETLESTPDDVFAELFDKKNTGEMIKLSQSEPEIFDTLRKKYLGDLMSKARTEGVVGINTNKFLKEVNGLSPEVQKLMFGSNAPDKLKAMNVIMSRMPKDINPSGTATLLEFKNMLHGLVADVASGDLMAPLKKAASQAGDITAYLMMRRQKAQYNNAIKQVVSEEVLRETAKATLEGQKKIMSIPKVIKETLEKKRGPIKSILIRGINANMTKAERQEEFKKLSDSITDHYVNLEKTTETLREHSELMGSEAISAPYTTKVMNGVQYLYNIMPKQTRVQNPFVKLPEYKPSQAEVDSFMTKVELVKNPYLIIDLFKEGLVNSEHIDVVKNVYPSVFGQIQTSFIDSFASGEQNNTSYGDRIRLALLLDVQTDQSMSPEKMMDLQAQFAAPQAPPSKPVNLKVSKASPVEQLSNIG